MLRGVLLRARHDAACASPSPSLLFPHFPVLNPTQTDVARPLVYITYGKPFWRDNANFSAQRYQPLPPLVKRRKR